MAPKSTKPAARKTPASSKPAPGTLESFWNRKPPQPAKSSKNSSKGKAAVVKKRPASRKPAPGTLDAFWNDPAAMGIESSHAGSSRTDAIVVDQSSDEEDFVLLTPKPVVIDEPIEDAQKVKWSAQPRLPYETITMIGRFAAVDTRAAVAATCGTLRGALWDGKIEGEVAIMGKTETGTVPPQVPKDEEVSCMKAIAQAQADIEHTLDRVQQLSSYGFKVHDEWLQVGPSCAFSLNDQLLRSQVATLNQRRRLLQSLFDA